MANTTTVTSAIQRLEDMVRWAHRNLTVSLAPSAGVQKVVPTSAGTRLTVYGPSGRYHSYRGTIVAQPSGGLLYVINVLPIEDYLRGLGEVPRAGRWKRSRPRSWPPAATP